MLQPIIFQTIHSFITIYKSTFLNISQPTPARRTSSRRSAPKVATNTSSRSNEIRSNFESADSYSLIEYFSGEAKSYLSYLKSDVDADTPISSLSKKCIKDCVDNGVHKTHIITVPGEEYYVYCLDSVVKILKTIRGSKTMTKEQILNFCSSDGTRLVFGVNVFSGFYGKDGLFTFGMKKFGQLKETFSPTIAAPKDPTPATQAKKMSFRKLPMFTTVLGEKSDAPDVIPAKETSPAQTPLPEPPPAKEPLPAQTPVPEPAPSKETAPAQTPVPEPAPAKETAPAQTPAPAPVAIDPAVMEHVAESVRGGVLSTLVTSRARPQSRSQSISPRSASPSPEFKRGPLLESDIDPFADDIPVVNPRPHFAHAWWKEHHSESCSNQKWPAYRQKPKVPEDWRKDRHPPKRLCQLKENCVRRAYDPAGAKNRVTVWCSACMVHMHKECIVQWHVQNTNNCPYRYSDY